MNSIKTLYARVFAAWSALVCVYALGQALGGAQPLASWLGLALAGASPLAFFTGSFMLKKNRSRLQPVGFSAAAGLGLALTMAMSHRYGQAAGLAHVWAGITLLGWVIYLRCRGASAQQDD